MSTSTNREKFPITSKIIDELREHFQGAQVTYCKEGNNEKGNKDTRSGVSLLTMYPGRDWEKPLEVAPKLSKKKSNIVTKYK